MKISKNKNGFTTIETLLTILVLAVVGFGGYYVWHSQDNKTKTAPMTTKTSASSNVSWKTATLKYEKITYQYPANWKVTDYSSSGVGCTTPGSDHVYLTSPNNQLVELQTGVSCIGDAGSQAFGSAIPITALGVSLYLVFENDSGDGSTPPTSPLFACLAPNTSPGSPFALTSKNILLNDSTATDKTTAESFCYYPYDVLTLTSESQIPKESVSSIENSTGFNTAKQIFESMHY